MTNFEMHYLFTQYGLLIGQICLLTATIFFYQKLVKNDNEREKRTIEGEIKRWCKCVFRTVDSPGALQRAGQQVRKKFPDRIDLILAAYDELFVEEQNRYLPNLSNFLESMDGVERGKWPSFWDLK